MEKLSTLELSQIVMGGDSLSLPRIAYFMFV